MLQQATSAQSHSLNQALHTAIMVSRLPGLLHSKKASFIIAWSFILHSFYVLPFVRADNFPYSRTCRGCIYGLILMLYPLSGWLTDKYLTRYKSMMIGLGFAIIGTAASIVLGNVYPNALIAGFTVVRIGHWFFEVNAMMYGFEQLQTYSIEDHRVFVYWFYWTLEIGHFVYGLVFCSLTTMQGADKASRITSTIIGSCQVVAMVFIAIVMLVKRQSFGDQNIGYHPLGKILTVIRQSLQRPIGMEKLKICKGGMHSADFVREIRTFLHILSIIGPLAILYYTEEIYTVAREFKPLNRNESEAFQQCILTEVPLWIRSTMATFFIPIYITVLTPLVTRISHYKWLLLRMAAGLFIAILGTLSLFGIQFTVYYTTKHNATISATLHLDNNTSHINNACSSVDSSLYYWLTLPELLNGLSVLVVFSTALEFICAQSSSAIRGLLIAIWFALDGLLKVIVTIQEAWELDCNIFYYIPKMAIIVVFLVIFLVCLRVYTKQNKRLELEDDSSYCRVSTRDSCNSSDYNSFEKSRHDYYEVTDSALLSYIKK